MTPTRTNLPVCSENQLQFSLASWHQRHHHVAFPRRHTVVLKVLRSNNFFIRQFPQQILRLLVLPSAVSYFFSQCKRKHPCTTWRTHCAPTRHRAAATHRSPLLQRWTYVMAASAVSTPTHCDALWTPWLHCLAMTTAWRRSWSCRRWGDDCCWAAATRDCCLTSSHSPSALQHHHSICKACLAH